MYYKFSIHFRLPGTKIYQTDKQRKWVRDIEREREREREREK